jgi:hypothetical protein
MAMIEAGQDVPIFKRASASRPSGQWSDEDFDVLADQDFDVLANGIVVGRIFKANTAPVGEPWMWPLDACAAYPHSWAAPRRGRCAPVRWVRSL